jgi:hypothetical protein
VTVREAGLDAESQARRELETILVQLAIRHTDTPGAHSAVGHGSMALYVIAAGMTEFQHELEDRP